MASAGSAVGCGAVLLLDIIHPLVNVYDEASTFHGLSAVIGQTHPIPRKPFLMQALFFHSACISLCFWHIQPFHTHSHPRMHPCQSVFSLSAHQLHPSMCVSAKQRETKWAIINIHAKERGKNLSGESIEASEAGRGRLDIDWGNGLRWEKLHSANVTSCYDSKE